MMACDHVIQVAVVGADVAARGVPELQFTDCHLNTKFSAQSQDEARPHGCPQVRGS